MTDWHVRLAFLNLLRAFRFWATIILVGNVADGLITYRGVLLFGLITETNPGVRITIEAVGPHAWLIIKIGSGSLATIVLWFITKRECQKGGSFDIATRNGKIVLTLTYAAISFLTVGAAVNNAVLWILSLNI